MSLEPKNFIGRFFACGLDRRLGIAYHDVPDRSILVGEVGRGKTGLAIECSLKLLLERNIAHFNMSSRIIRGDMIDENVRDTVISGINCDVTRIFEFGHSKEKRKNAQRSNGDVTFECDIHPNGIERGTSPRNDFQHKKLSMFLS